MPKTNKKFEIAFIFHGATHYLIDDTSGSAKEAVKAVKRDYSPFKLISVKEFRD